MSAKLQKGLQQLRDAGHNKDLLGMSLISLHGALEDFVRELLKDEIAAYNSQTGRDRSGWQDLINLLQTHRGLTYDEKEMLHTQNGKRNRAAHGETANITRPEIEEYAQFVQKFMSNYRVQRSGRSPARPRQQRQQVRQTRRPATPNQSRSAPTKQKRSCISRLATAVIVILILCGGLYYGGLYLIDKLDLNELNPLTNPALESEPSADGLDEEVGAEETVVPAPSSSTPATQTAPTTAKETIQVQQDSNVRSGPGTEFDIVGGATANETYEVLETTADRNWFKIKLASDEEGWIGSTRVTLISP